MMFIKKIQSRLSKKKLKKLIVFIIIMIGIMMTITSGDSTYNNHKANKVVKQLYIAVKKGNYSAFRKCFIKEEKENSIRNLFYYFRIHYLTVKTLQNKFRIKEISEPFSNSITEHSIPEDLSYLNFSKEVEVYHSYASILWYSFFDDCNFSDSQVGFNCSLVDDNGDWKLKVLNYDLFLTTIKSKSDAFSNLDRLYDMANSPKLTLAQLKSLPDDKLSLLSVPLDYYSNIIKPGKHGDIVWPKTEKISPLNE